nr:MAG TPA: hypothetical protein [Caudoviricetes sp.]
MSMNIFRHKVIVKSIITTKNNITTNLMFSSGGTPSCAHI